ncbi:VanZ family protein [Phanerochaete sordida]|uniref:VanZ family protein n=1 Tax=Phanerochaete sordida TaxID=48140 RepID=A0A9P3LKJ8_9APHY|nr:VanZ family protein [Phanerochaete sordida]
MLGLDSQPSGDSLWSRAVRGVRKSLRKATKGVMRSYHVRLPKYDMPLRFRPWFLLFTAIIMIALAFLGFTNFSHSLPLNDKMLHFICLMLATGVFYFIFDVEEDARRIWFWHHSPVIFTGVMCFFFGGIVSEFVQSLLPYKEYQIGDVFANLLGSSVGLYIAYHLERYYRHRREISRLYRPLNVEDDFSDEEDLEAGAQLLPTHVESAVTRDVSKPPTKGSRLADVWDEGEELFDIGAESEEEGEASHPRESPPIAHLPDTTR